MVPPHGVVLYITGEHETAPLHHRRPHFMPGTAHQGQAQGMSGWVGGVPPCGSKMWFWEGNTAVYGMVGHNLSLEP